MPIFARNLPGDETHQPAQNTWGLHKVAARLVVVTLGELPHWQLAYCSSDELFLQPWSRAV